jgi:glycerol kinase
MYILALDYGTTAIKACLVNRMGQTSAASSRNFRQIYPNPGWVEHDPVELWESTLPLIEETLEKAGSDWTLIEAIGITNQRETTILWDSDTGKPVHNAIVWQCRRTTTDCEALKQQGLDPFIQQKTGLRLDPYFSATKILWILKKLGSNSPTLKFGTVDSWIIWNLSGRLAHVTDPTNASRTLIFNIHTQQWDPDLLTLFNIRSELLPEVKRNNFAETVPELTGGRSIPIAGIAGDQQAALFGQKCWEPGTGKATFGTGTFIVMNSGIELSTIPEGLLATLAYDENVGICYALEGSIFMAGAILEWLKNQLEIIISPQEADQLAASLTDNGGVYLIPAFAGLGAPQWNPDARALICGLTQGTGKAHISRAALEAIAYQTRDVIDLIEIPIKKLQVDGGVTKSPFLMQFLADQIKTPVVRANEANVTLLGVAYLAGLNSGFWPNGAAIKTLASGNQTFQPQSHSEKADLAYKGWKQTLSFLN